MMLHATKQDARHHWLRKTVESWGMELPETEAQAGQTHVQEIRPLLEAHGITPTHRLDDKHETDTTLAEHALLRYAATSTIAATPDAMSCASGTEASTEDTTQAPIQRTSSQPSPHQVFLGGACNPTTWRKEAAIPFLEAHGITYYNPQVEEWYPALMQEEEQAKRDADVLLFVFDARTRGISSMVEVAFNAASRAGSLVVMLEPLPAGTDMGEGPLDQRQLDDLNRGREILRVLLRDEGVPVFTATHDALSYCACLLRRRQQRQQQQQQKQQQQQQKTFEGDAAHSGGGPVPRLLSQITTVLHMPTSRSRGSDDGGSMRLTHKDVKRNLHVLFGEEVGDGEFEDLMALLPCRDQATVDVECFVVLCTCLASTQHVVPHDRFAAWLSEMERPSQSLASDVYLGGSCGSTRWRQEVEQQLSHAGLTSFNPDVPRWSGAMIHMEAEAKRCCAAMLYVVSGETRGIGSLVEAAYYLGKGRRVFLVVQDVPEHVSIAGRPISELQRKDLNRGRSYLRDAARERRIHVWTEVPPCVAAVTQQFQR